MRPRISQREGDAASAKTNTQLEQLLRKVSSRQSACRGQTLYLNEVINVLRYNNVVFEL